jgi:threonine synthase
MQYYSTNGKINNKSLKEAVIEGLAEDNGLFMPNEIKPLPNSFFENIDQLSFQEIAFEVAKQFFGGDIPSDDLKEIVFDTLSFDCPVVEVENNIWSLELFHGPTAAFKDVGGRFMARMLRYFLQNENRKVNVLAATSGDTGSAVANGFLGVDGIHVYVLYPKGKVSEIQEKQFTTLGQNITAIEVDGTFDDCQKLVKQAFLDEELNSKLLLTSANSINVARFLPQAFYYFHAYAQLKKQGKLNGELIVAVPSGNFGNLTAGLFAQKMGLPISQFIAANNENDVVYQYLQEGDYHPKQSVETIANAMDVGNPSNFARILDLYKKQWDAIRSNIAGARFSDAQINSTINSVYAETGYILDPHGACGYQALKDQLKNDQTGMFLETAHPAKFIETVEAVIGDGKVTIPDRLLQFMKGEKQSIELAPIFDSFSQLLINEH